MPSEFYGLVDFINYCASAFPPTLDSVPWWQRPAHLTRLARLRFDEVRGLGG